MCSFGILNFGNSIGQLCLLSSNEMSGNTCMSSSGSDRMSSTSLSSSVSTSSKISPTLARSGTTFTTISQAETGAWPFMVVSIFLTVSSRHLQKSVQMYSNKCRGMRIAHKLGVVVHNRFHTWVLGTIACNKKEVHIDTNHV